MSKRSKGKQGGRKSTGPSAPRASTPTPAPIEAKPRKSATPAPSPVTAAPAPAPAAKPAPEPAPSASADRDAPEADEAPPSSHPAELPGAGETGQHQRIEEASFFARAEELAAAGETGRHRPAEHDDQTGRHAAVASPELLARRAQLRQRIVLPIVAVAAVLVLVGVVRAWPSDTKESSGGHAPVATATATATTAATPTATAAPTATQAEPETTPSAEPAATASAAPAPTASAETVPARLLVGLDLETPPAPTPAVEKTWVRARDGLAKGSFEAADAALAELGKNADPTTRDTARLARALLWTKNGRAQMVAPVLADLAKNAVTPAIRARAAELAH